MKVVQTTIGNLPSSKWNSENVFSTKHSLYVKQHFRLTITIAVLDKMCAGERTVCTSQLTKLLSDHRVTWVGQFYRKFITIIIITILSLH